MKHTFKPVGPTILMLVAITLLWNLSSAWLPVGRHEQTIARAAALSVQPVAIAPLSVPGLASRAAGVVNSPQSPDPNAVVGITYQGRLLDNNAPANGQYDFVFTLYDALSGGSQVSTPVAFSDQMVSSGLFTEVLNFGPTAFSGEARWLEIGVRQSGGGSYTTLSPRQLLSAAPFALGSRWEGTSDKPSPYNSLPKANVISTVSATGSNNSNAVGADGLGLIAYSDYDAQVLKVAHCSDLACSSSTISTVDPSTNVGAFSSITIGADGLPLISYAANSNAGLKVAHCSDPSCNSATYGYIDQGANADYTSVTVGVDGLGLISYGEYLSGSLRVAHCSNVACTSATISTLGAQGAGGEYNSITIGADGLGLISFADQYNSDLKVAHCSNVACTSATLTILDSQGWVGKHTSIALGTDGLGIISYYDETNQHLKVAHCSNTACTSAILSTIDSTTGVGIDTSMTIGVDGLGLISYGTNVLGVKVAHCSNVVCSSATTTTVDPSLNVPECAITLGSDGLGLITYISNESMMKVAHCAGPLCVSYLSNSR